MPTGYFNLQKTYQTLPITLTGLTGLYYIERNEHLAFWFLAPTFIAIWILMVRTSVRGNRDTSVYAETDEGGHKIGKNWRQDFFAAAILTAPILLLIIGVMAENAQMRFFEPRIFVSIIVLSVLLTTLTIFVEEKFNAFVNEGVQLTREIPFRKLKFFTKDTFWGGARYIFRMVVITILIIVLFTAAIIAIDLTFSPPPHEF